MICKNIMFGWRTEHFYVAEVARNDLYWYIMKN